MDANLLITLQNYGISEKEARVYLTVLELGTSASSTIARRMGENRVTVYSILKNLVKRGIASETSKQHSTYYSVIGPEKLLQKMEDKYQSIKDALPQFLAVANKYNNKPQVQFFDGMEGLKNIYEDQLTSKEELLSFLGVAEVDTAFKKYLYEDFLPRRVKAKIHAKVIVSSDAANKLYASIDKKNLKETLVISNPLFSIENEIVIYGGSKVSISLFSPNEMSGLIITSKTLHNTLANLFNLTRASHRHAKKK